MNWLEFLDCMARWGIAIFIAFFACGLGIFLAYKLIGVL